MKVSLLAIDVAKQRFRSSLAGTRRLDGSRINTDKDIETMLCAVEALVDAKVAAAKREIVLLMRNTSGSDAMKALDGFEAMLQKAFEGHDAR